MRSIQEFVIWHLLISLLKQEERSRHSLYELVFPIIIKLIWTFLTDGHTIFFMSDLCTYPHFLDSFLIKCSYRLAEVSVDFFICQIYRSIYAWKIYVLYSNKTTWCLILQLLLHSKIFFRGVITVPILEKVILPNFISNWSKKGILYSIFKY